MNKYFNPDEQGYEKGGLTSRKAKEILRDGTAHGHKLTPKQKRFFGYIAGGGNPNKQVGGPIISDPLNPNRITQRTTSTDVANNQFAMDSGQNNLFYAADLIGANVASGLLPNQDPNFGAIRTTLNPQLYQYLYQFNQRSDLQGMTPQQRVQTFYDIPANDPSVQAMKERLRSLGYGPQEVYRSNRLDKPAPVPTQPIVQRQMGGMTLNTPEQMAQGFNNPEFQQFSSLQFPATDPNQARYFTPANIPIMAQDQQGNLAYLGPGSEGQYLQGAVNEYQMKLGGMMEKEYWNRLPTGLRKRLQNNIIKRMGGYAKDC